jgi:hypothetical protein
MGTIKCVCWELLYVYGRVSRVIDLKLSNAASIPSVDVMIVPLSPGV